MSNENLPTTRLPGEVDFDKPDVKLPSEIRIGKTGIVLRTVHDLAEIASRISASKMVPASLDTPAKVAVAILTGTEAGLGIMAAARAVYVVNGAGAWVSEAARALVRNSGLLRKGTKIEEGVRHADGCKSESDPKARCLDGCHGFCRTWRDGDDTAVEHTFSVVDARRAGLWDKQSHSGKPSNWLLYPKRMLQHRAAGFHFKDRWSDVLMGLPLVEEAMDYPPAAFVGRGESVALNAEPPGIDPLLARASCVVGETGSAPVETVTQEDVEPDADPNPDAPIDIPTEPESPQAEPPADDEVIVKCEACPRRFSRKMEAHWPYPGPKYRCAECGPREPIR